MADTLALIILGILAGGAAAAVMSFFVRMPKGGWILHAILGIVGAWVGGFLFAALDIEAPGLFSGTIESNLRYADKNASVEILKESADIAQASEFIFA